MQVPAGHPRSALGMPPAWAERTLTVAADDTYSSIYRDAAAADGYWFAIFDGFDQLRQVVLGVGYADLHLLMIAI